MKKNVVRLFIVGICVIVVLLTSCAVAQKTPVITTSNTLTATTSKSTTVIPEKPQLYGGTLTFSNLGELGVFDGIATGQGLGQAAQLARDPYLSPDWTRGAAGTGEFHWFDTTSITPDSCMGTLAESWAMPEQGTIIFQVRQGVHWQYNPESEASRMMKGREVTADDWIASFNYLINSQTLKTYVPQLVGTATMEKTGPWEVTLKTPIDPFMGWSWLAVDGLFPPEVIAKYGNLQDWHNFVSTGPYTITDYVPGSSATLIRNTNYWQTDPIGPTKGNRLPYIENIKILVISDISTDAAAARTGKIDFYINVVAPDYLHELQAGLWPDVEYTTYLAAHPMLVVMRNDRQDLPFKDKRVRQALMLATDFNGLKNYYYEGEADLFGFPVTREAGRAYMPLEDMSESAQALYRYNPEKARQLLTDAGYPEGFEINIVFSTEFDCMELASTLNAMWAKVGIELVLQPKEPGIFASIAYSRSYDEMLLSYWPYGSAYPACLNLGNFRGWNAGYVTDPVLESAYQEIQKHILIDMPEADRLFREQLPYIVEQAYYIPFPTSYSYSSWYRWLKNYHGETYISMAKYWWIDQDLKKQLTGK
jgi:peptide/nickel transport system substrate-binding protein